MIISLPSTTFVSLLHNLKPVTQFDTQSLYFESPVIVYLYIKNIKNLYIKEKHNSNIKIYANQSVCVQLVENHNKNYAIHVNFIAYAYFNKRFHRLLKD